MVVQKEERKHKEGTGHVKRAGQIQLSKDFLSANLRAFFVAALDKFVGILLLYTKGIEMPKWPSRRDQQVLNCLINSGIRGLVGQVIDYNCFMTPYYR